MLWLRFGTEPTPVDADALIAAAAEAAARADVALVVVGTNSVVESEGYDRASLALPGRQDDLVRAVAAANPRTVVLVNAGSPVLMPWRDQVAAVLVGYFGGQEFGHAVADVLLGAAEPGGRLPTTWPAGEADVPVLSTTPTDGALDYAEGIHIGYRAWLRQEAAPAYWFGSGRGYTDITLTGAQAPASVTAGDSFPVTVEVENHGGRDGKQVVQVYAERPDSAVDRPVRWLVGFAVIRVPAGQKAQVQVSVPTRLLAYWQDGWRYEPGVFQLRVGHLRRRPADDREGGAHLMFPNPLIPGFSPDPSITRADGAYYLATSTFEYLPGIPVYRSTDLASWTHIGNVAPRPEQVSVADVATGGGVWAPTIRYHDGVFYIIVTVAMSPRGCVVFTATDPAGPWSDGVPIDGVGGIDPDLAWDDDGTAYVTFSGLSTSGEEMGQHLGIQQVRVDLVAGKALEPPRSLWSGTGLKFPEAPHLYHRGDDWYLLIAEGGTERGHSVSVARGPSPEGPFEGHPANPVLSACGTSRPIQNTGHADLVDTPDGGTALVLLGVRPLGLTQSFSPLGRETFITPVSWADGWPQPEPVLLNPREAVDEEVFDFADPVALEEPGWLAIRTPPGSVASLADGRLSITGHTGLDDPQPQFVGRRQRHLTATVSATVDASGGTGGLAARYDEHHWFCLEVRGSVVTARAHVAGLAQAWEVTVPAGDVELRMEMSPPAATFNSAALGGDRIRLLAAGTLVAELDGRYWTAETCASFTGRVIGLYASAGTVRFAGFRYRGSDA